MHAKRLYGSLNALSILQVAALNFVCMAELRTEDNFCVGKNTTVTCLQLPPFVMQSKNISELNGKQGILWEFVYHNIQYCFPKCDMASIKFVFVNNTEDFRNIIEQGKTDLAFPISSSIERDLQHYDHFLDTSNQIMFYKVVESPGQAFVICREVFQERARKTVVNALLASWPIFVFTFLLAGISGVCIWVLEAHVNKEQFPVSFSKGSCEGMWWAFVSMTTVGYGDRTPKTLCGRLFGVIWILTGLTVIAMFTATATSSLALARDNNNNGILGAKVGVLRESDAELQAALQGASATVYGDFHVMYEDLKAGVIDGVLSDFITAAYQLDELNDNELRISHVFPKQWQYKLAIIQQRSGQQILMNECFRNRLYNPSSLAHELVMKYIRPLKPLDKTVDADSLFSINYVVTRSILFVLFGVFLGMIIVGLVWEVIYRKKHKRKLKIRQEYNKSKESADKSTLQTCDQGDNGEVLRHINMLEQGIIDMSKELKKLKRSLTGKDKNRTYCVVNFKEIHKAGHKEDTIL